MTTRPTRLVLSLVVCCAAAAATRAAEKSVLVGDYGDVRHIKVLGAATFSTATIQDALFDDPDVLAPLHPSAPLDKLEALLCEKVRQGYLRAGFPHVKVACQRLIVFSELVLRVEEGPRFQCGEIRVSGASEAPVAELIRAITSPRPELKAASMQLFEREGWSDIKWFDAQDNEIKAEVAWPKGEFARLDTQHLSNLRRDIGVALEGLGFYFAQFDAGIAYDLPANRVRLHITIEAEGPRARLGEIEITGHKRHTREQILAYLKLDKSSDVVQQDCLRLEHELYSSGRFTQARVTMARPDVKADPKVLQIAIVEHPRVSPLSEPLSPEEQTFLKLRNWLTDFERRGDDLVIASHDSNFPGELIVSPRNGLLLSMRDGGQPAGPFAWSVLATNRELGFYGFGDQRKFVVPWEGKLTVKTSVGFTKPADEPRARKMAFSIKWTTLRDDQTEPGWELATRLSPVNFLHMAHDKAAKTSWSGDVLTAVDDLSRIRVHGPSGALLECQIFDDQGKDWGRVAFAPGLLSAQIEKTEAALKNKPNEYQPQRRVTSALRFFSAERLLWQAMGRDEPDLQTVLVMRKLLDRVVFAPLDGVAKAPGDAKPKGESFEIPKQPAYESESELDWLVLPLAESCLKLQDVLVPRDSWLAITLRNESLQALEHREHAKADYTGLYLDSKSGPVCLLASSYLLDFRAKTGQRLFAEKGLERLSTEEFRKDYRPLLSSEHLLGQCLVRTAAGIQELTDEEAKVFDDSLLKPAVQWLRQEKNRPLETVLPEALDKMWEQGLQARVAALLREQARPPEAE